MVQIMRDGGRSVRRQLLFLFATIRIPVLLAQGKSLSFQVRAWFFSSPYICLAAGLWELWESRRSGPSFPSAVGTGGKRSLFFPGFHSASVSIAWLRATTAFRCRRERRAFSPTGALAVKGTPGVFE